VKGILIGIVYGIILVVGWELQKWDLLLGYTITVFGILATTFFLVDYLARKLG
jgi:hypothetical protein